MMDIRNDFNNAPAGQPGPTLPAAPRGQGKQLDDQIREIQRLVDGAVENLEQVHRALRFIGRES
jgi:hypothetical protein